MKSPSTTEILYWFVLLILPGVTAVTLTQLFPPLYLLWGVALASFTVAATALSINLFVFTGAMALLASLLSSLTLNYLIGWKIKPAVK